MNIGIVKYIGTIIEGYNKNKFQPGETYQFKNNIPGQYEIYDMSGKTLIDTIGLRTFNKCFEGLTLSKKKYQPKYFDWDTDEEFPYEEIDQHPEWYKHEYDNNGNTIYYNTSYGYWEKREFDQWGNVIYRETSDGDWEKREYDADGNRIYYENREGVIRYYRDQIQEGLMLPYKKIRYFDENNDKEFSYKDKNEHPAWYKEEYDNNENVIYREFYDGYWQKFQYDNNERQTYYEDCDGHWRKWEYNENGNVIYAENNNGIITDNRDQIQEGLMLSYKKFPDRYFEDRTNKEFPKSEINEHPEWFKEEYDNNGNVIYREFWDGYWVKIKYDTNNRKIYVEENNGKWTKFKRDENGRLIYKENSDGYWAKYEYDTDGNRIYYEDINGRWYKKEYDNNGNLIYLEDNWDGVTIDNRNQIQEGLMLSYKRIKYFDDITNKEFPKSEINEHPEWFKEEYDNNGNVARREYYDGYWAEYKRTIDGKVLYFEDSDGHWEKYEYDNNGRRIYYEDGGGHIIDDRDQIQEGLMLPYKQLNKTIFILSFPYEESGFVTAVELIKYAQEQTLELMNEEEYVDSVIVNVKTIKDAIWNLELFGHTITEVNYSDLPKKVTDDLDTDGFSAIDNTETISEGLMLPYKKIKYYDLNTGEEFPKSEINEHPQWYKYEYDTNGKNTYSENSNGEWIKHEYDQHGNEIYREDSDGYWSKFEYNTNGKEIYYEDISGYWEKREYDENGNEIYYEDSDGYIIDDRDQIQEGLMLQYKKHYEPKPDTEMASLFFTLQNLTFAEYVDEIIYTEDDKIQISKNNKMVTISEQQGNFIVTMFLNDDVIKEKSFDSTTDKIYWMDIEDAVDSFLYDPNEPLHEGLMLPYKKKYSPAEKWFKDLLNQITVYNSPYYPDSIFFHINKEVYMEYNKNSKALYYNLKKIEWFLKSEFGISSYQINDLVHEMIEKHYELEVNVVLSVFLPNIA